MARYRNAPVGVFDTVASQLITPASGMAWLDYLAWLNAGNVPDPYVPPAPPAETLAEAKLRRIAELRREGMERVRVRFPAIRDFDTLQLLRELYLSIATAARAPTTDWTWLTNTYAAGATAASQVNAATTIAQVDAVTANWPA